MEDCRHQPSDPEFSTGERQSLICPLGVSGRLPLSLDAEKSLSDGEPLSTA